MHEIPATWRSVLADRIKSNCLTSHRAGWEKDFEGVSVRRWPKGRTRVDPVRWTVCHLVIVVSGPYLPRRRWARDSGAGMAARQPRGDPLLADCPTYRLFYSWLG
jgi:hypothetical protein